MKSLLSLLILFGVFSLVYANAQDIQPLEPPQVVQTSTLQSFANGMAGASEHSVISLLNDASPIVKPLGSVRFGSDVTQYQEQHPLIVILNREGFNWAYVMQEFMR